VDFGGMDGSKSRSGRLSVQSSQGRGCCAKWYNFKAQLQARESYAKE